MTKGMQAGCPVRGKVKSLNFAQGCPADRRVDGERTAEPAVKHSPQSTKRNFLDGVAREGADFMGRAL